MQGPLYNLCFRYFEEFTSQLEAGVFPCDITIHKSLPWQLLAVLNSRDSRGRLTRVLIRSAGVEDRYWHNLPNGPVIRYEETIERCHQIVLTVAGKELRSIKRSHDGHSPWLPGWPVLLQWSCIACTVS